MHKDNGEWLVVLQGIWWEKCGVVLRFCNGRVVFWGGEILLGVFEGGRRKNGGWENRQGGRGKFVGIGEGGRARRAGRRRRP